MLTDFGTVVVGELTKTKITTTQTAAGVVRWTAPEILDVDPMNPRLSRKNAAVDVFAFGRMCLSVSAVATVHQVSGDAMVSEYMSFNQISTKKSPFYPDITTEELVRDMVERGETPRKPTDEECDGAPILEDLWSLANDCWKMEAKQRPSMGRVLERLRHGSLEDIPSASPGGINEHERLRHGVSSEDFPSTSPDGITEHEKLRHEMSSEHIPPTSPDGITEHEQLQHGMSSEDIPSTSPGGINEHSRLRHGVSSEDIPSTSPDGITEHEQLRHGMSSEDIPSTSPGGINEHSQWYMYFASLLGCFSSKRG
jgi:hypothetical protein